MCSLVPPSSQYFLQVSGPHLKKDLGSTCFQKLLSYRDDGPLPAYVELGRACLNEDPDQRPTFEKAFEVLQELLATFRANDDMTDEDSAESPADPIALQRSQAKCWLRRRQQEALERMRLVAESVRGASGERLFVSECITCLGAHGSTLFKGTWDGRAEVAVREALLVQGAWDDAEKRSLIERVLRSHAVPGHPNPVSQSAGECGSIDHSAHPNLCNTAPFTAHTP